MKPELESYKYFISGLVKQLAPNNIIELGLGSTASTSEEILKVICGNDYPNKNTKLFIMDFSPNEIALGILKGFDSNKYFTKWVDSQDLNNYYDFNCSELVLIDADHNAQNVFNDIKNILMSNKITYNGIFIFHDVSCPTVRHGISAAKEHFKLETFLMPEINIGIARLNNSLD